MTAAVWSDGGYEQLAEHNARAAAELVSSLGPRAGERRLDIGVGPGSVAVAAVRAGADVVRPVRRYLLTTGTRR
jgi:trans-aconitate methyltransferase